MFYRCMFFLSFYVVYPLPMPLAYNIPNIGLGLNLRSRSPSNFEIFI